MVFSDRYFSKYVNSIKKYSDGTTFYLTKGIDNGEIFINNILFLHNEVQEYCRSKNKLGMQKVFTRLNDDTPHCFSGLVLKSEIDNIFSVYLSLKDLMENKNIKESTDEKYEKLNKLKENVGKMKGEIVLEKVTPDNIDSIYYSNIAGRKNAGVIGKGEFHNPQLSALVLQELLQIYTDKVFSIYFLEYDLPTSKLLSKFDDLRNMIRYPIQTMIINNYLRLNNLHNTISEFDKISLEELENIYLVLKNNIDSDPDDEDLYKDFLNKYLYVPNSPLIKNPFDPVNTDEISSSDLWILHPPTKHKIIIAQHKPIFFIKNNFMTLYNSDLRMKNFFDKYFEINSFCLQSDDAMISHSDSMTKLLIEEYNKYLEKNDPMPIKLFNAIKISKIEDLNKQFHMQLEDASKEGFTIYKSIF